MIGLVRTRLSAVAELDMALVSVRATDLHSTDDFAANVRGEIDMGFFSRKPSVADELAAQQRTRAIRPRRCDAAPSAPASR